MVVLGNKYRDEVLAVQNVEGDYIIFHKKKGIPRRVCVITAGSLSEVQSRLSLVTPESVDDAETVLDLVLDYCTIIS